MSGEDDTSQQCDEVEAISAIYGDDFTVVDQYQSEFSITVTVSPHTVNLFLRLPNDYPSSSPPYFEVQAPWMHTVQRKQLINDLNMAYLDHVGECVMYLWAERVREFLQGLVDEVAAAQLLADTTLCDELDHIPSSPTTSSCPSCPPITSGELIIDRKSVFQPHLARVTAVEQVPLVLSRLKENRKIATATHNIYAYRIELHNGATNVLAQDCEDDGETKAGSRLLHLMGVLDVLDVLVVVTRWYGGCHLGPDRFKHINNAARNILEQCGMLDQHKTGKEGRLSGGSNTASSSSSKKVK